MPRARRRSSLPHRVEEQVMSSGEVLYLMLVLSTFGGFGLWVGYSTWRYDRSRQGRPAVRYLEDPHHAPHDATHGATHA